VTGSSGPVIAGSWAEGGGFAFYIRKLSRASVIPVQVGMTETWVHFSSIHDAYQSN
jgi:hypothetical protein